MAPKSNSTEDGILFFILNALAIYGLWNTEDRISESLDFRKFIAQSPWLSESVPEHYFGRRM